MKQTICAYKSANTFCHFVILPPLNNSHDSDCFVSFNLLCHLFLINLNLPATSWSKQNRLPRSGVFCLSTLLNRIWVLRRLTCTASNTEFMTIIVCLLSLYAFIKAQMGSSVKTCIVKFKDPATTQLFILNMKAFLVPPSHLLNWNFFYSVKIGLMCIDNLWLTFLSDRSTRCNSRYLIASSLWIWKSTTAAHLWEKEMP